MVKHKDLGSEPAILSVLEREAKMNRRAFTLVELLVVIAIIGVLVGLLLSAVQAAREAARRMSCSNNLKQLGLTLHNYESAHKRLPYGLTNGTGLTHAHCWSESLLPFMELGVLFLQIDFNPRTTIPVIQDVRVNATDFRVFFRQWENERKTSYTRGLLRGDFRIVPAVHFMAFHAIC